MHMQYPPRDNLCYMANVITLQSYKTVMIILSSANVACLLGSDVVSLLALVYLHKVLRKIQPAIDPVQSALSSETYKVHKAIVRTLIIVLIIYHLSVVPIAIGSTFALLTNKPIQLILGKIIGIASFLNALINPIIIMTRQAKLKRSLLHDVQTLKRALCYRTDIDI
ncbi:hypothetical protein DPMN_009737 [Dreissena polymorpha]|uniref:G-protein coupled receptors family 1 profile domain-containing protein n=1 Tax=Dreissena polymorpha TaxID=45954 RepID=A0A9D4MYL9_DREPO|nr:hypothetical protein DPMN_009737 [Dreissena polymorpha]